MVVGMNEKFISHGIETKILAQIRDLVRQKAKTGKEKEKNYPPQHQQKQQAINAKIGKCW